MTQFFEPIPYPLWQSDKAAFAAALGRSFRETGFAVVTGHPVSQQAIDDNLAATKASFALPADAKEQYHDAPGGRQRGYTPFATENAKGQSKPDLKEFSHTGRDLPSDSPYRATMKDTPSVSEVADFDRATRALYASLDEFGAELLKAVALHLKLPESWFDDKVNFGNSILRLLHYPPQMDPPPEGSVRAGAHEDINVITLLLGAEEAGLEVKHRSGQWLGVTPPPGALVINCGDMLEMASGGYFPSTVHRVVNPEKTQTGARFSMPMFLHPRPEVVLKPGTTADDFLQERLREIGSPLDRRAFRIIHEFEHAQVEFRHHLA